MGSFRGGVSFQTEQGYSGSDLGQDSETVDVRSGWKSLAASTEKAAHTPEKRWGDRRERRQQCLGLL